MGILAALAAAAAARAAAPAPASAPLRLQRIVVRLPSREVVHVTLRATAPAARLAAGLTAQRLTLAGASVALAAPVDVTVEGSGTRVDFDLPLRQVPETVLAADPNRMPVLWEGLGADGAPVLAAAGTVDLGDPGDVELPLADLYQAYARWSDFTVTPGLSAVSVHGLLALNNPFAFDLVVGRIEAHVKVGAQPILDATRPGFRLHAGRSSDVLIEQDVPLADVAGGMSAFLHGETAALDGVLVLRTPGGDRPIPLHLSTGR